jgi:hypothetical protein
MGTQDILRSMRHLEHRRTLRDLPGDTMSDFSITSSVGGPVVARFTCERCGQQRETLNITAFGDREPRYALGLECDCPGPRCPFSHGRLDHHGRCADIDCFMWMQIIPLPEVA